MGNPPKEYSFLKRRIISIAIAIGIGPNLQNFIGIVIGHVINSQVKRFRHRITALSSASTNAE